MNSSIVAILLMVATTSGLCIATDNIFNEKYENRYTNSERAAAFRDVDDLDPEIVAYWLAKSAYKSMEIEESGVTIKDLLRLAEFDRQSAKDCTRARVEHYRMISAAVRSPFSFDYEYYTDYSNYCLEKLFEHCTALGHYKEFEGFGRAIFGDLGNPKDNIFGVEYEDYNLFEALVEDEAYGNDRLILDIETIADVLARSNNKWLEVAPDVSINALLRLAEIDLSSANDCNRQRVDKSKEICEQVSGASIELNLPDYCEYCVEKLTQHCEAMGVNNLV